jgi:hypothetical protein
VAQDRMGAARTRVGAINAGAPPLGFKDNSLSVILPLSATHMLLGAKSTLTFGLLGNSVSSQPNKVDTEGFVGLASISYAYFPTMTSMLRAEVYLEKANLDLVGVGTVDFNRTGVRLDALAQISEHWGVAGRLQYAKGELDTGVFLAPPVVLQHAQGDDLLYAQFNLQGQYRTADLSYVPEGWVFHPGLGVNFRRNFIEATANSFGAVSSGVVGATEDYGTVWADAVLQREARPGEWAPSMHIGLSHEYADSLALGLEENNYALVGVGLSRMGNDGSRLGVNYDLQRGFNGNITNHSLVVSYNISF